MNRSGGMKGRGARRAGRGRTHRRAPCSHGVGFCRSPAPGEARQQDRRNGSPLGRAWRRWPADSRSWRSCLLEAFAGNRSCRHRPPLLSTVGGAPRCLGMEMVRQLVPDRLWELFRRVMPEAPVRPQGGGRRKVDDREVLAAILFVATSGCTWRQLPPVFGTSWQTAHRRITHWTEAQVWAKGAAEALSSRADVHRVVLDELGARRELDWSRCAIDSVSSFQLHAELVRCRARTA